MEFLENSTELAAQQQADTDRFKGRRAEDRKAYGRSRLSNSHDLLPHIDGRTLLARRYRDIASALVNQQGGEKISEARLQLCRRFAASACMAEQLEAMFAAGEEVSIERHALLVSSLVRLAGKLGIDPIMIDNTPSLDVYLRDNVEAAE